jgi:O-methyltransferase involved in polyketide biosynthesis
MDQKEKITLMKEQETLLIPLYAKAQDNPILVDDTARQILARADYDFSLLKVPQKTAVTLCIRAKQLDHYTRRFLAGHPGALVLHLGCGLDSRCRRVDWQGQGVDWYDLDMPDVIALRRRFFPEAGAYHLVASSVTDLGWVDGVAGQDRPVLAVAEGLLMYLREAEVRALFLRLRERFPGCELAADVFSRLTAERIRAHPSLRKTGAAVHWGIDDPRAIETWAPGIRLLEEWTFDQSSDLARLGWLYALLFRLASAIPAARMAQRLLYYRLG